MGAIFCNPIFNFADALFRNEHWQWVDLDSREFEIEFEVDSSIDLNSTIFKRSVLTLNLDGKVRNVEPKETVPIIGCQFNLRI